VFRPVEPGVGKRMIHVLLRIAVWVLVFGIGYLVFGPQLFDSSRSADPFASDEKLFLPPVKDQRQIEYEKIMTKRELERGELEAYRALVRERQSKFWAREGISVEQALSGVQKQRKEFLIKLLMDRGMSSDELTVFLMVLERDHAALLADRE